MSNPNTTPEKLNENDSVFDTEPETQAPADNEPPKPSKDEKQKKSACSDAGRSSDAWMFPNYGRSCE